MPRIRCWDHDRTRLVQFSPDEFYVNLVGEYPGWTAFIEHLRDALQALAKIVTMPIKFKRVNLVTIDKWKVTKSEFRIGQYLNCGGRFVPEWYTDVAVASDISLGQGFYEKDGFNKRLRITVRPSINDVQFQMVASFGEATPGDDIETVMERLHKESVECFESIITDRVREEVMGGRQ